MKINFKYIYFAFFIIPLNIFCQDSNEKDAFFLDLGVVIEPSTGKEKVDHLVKAPPSKVSFFLDKKPSGSVFMASTKEIALMLEDIQNKVDNIQSNFGKDLMQQERNKAAQNLQNQISLDRLIHKLKTLSTSDEVGFGSLVLTNFGWFFIGLPLGKINFEDQEILCISGNAPVAKILERKRVGASISVNGKNTQILTIK